MELVICLVGQVNVTLARHLNELLRDLSQVHVNLCVSQLGRHHWILPHNWLYIDNERLLLLLILQRIFAVAQNYIWYHLCRL